MTYLSCTSLHFFQDTHCDLEPVPQGSFLCVLHLSLWRSSILVCFNPLHTDIVGVEVRESSIRKYIEVSVHKSIEMLKRLLYMLTSIIPSLQLGLLNHYSSSITLHFYSKERKRRLWKVKELHNSRCCYMQTRLNEHLSYYLRVLLGIPHCRISIIFMKVERLRLKPTIFIMKFPLGKMLERTPHFLFFLMESYPIIVF